MSIAVSGAGTSLGATAVSAVGAGGAASFAGAGAGLPLAGGVTVTALPKAGVGGIEDNASMNFLIVGSVLMLLYFAIGFIIRRGHARPELEDDGIAVW